MSSTCGSIKSKPAGKVRERAGHVLYMVVEVKNVFSSLT
jgi:hypothetical protein